MALQKIRQIMYIQRHTQTDQQYQVYIRNIVSAITNFKQSVGKPGVVAPSFNPRNQLDLAGSHILKEGIKFKVVSATKEKVPLSQFSTC